MTLRAAFAFSVVSLSLPVGCGSATRNACERWQDHLLSLDCVPDDYEVGVDCREFDDYPCDATAYFECLERADTCSADGEYQSDPAACSSPC
ncbi:MAG: hypothetical protein ACO3JL_00165 [Myxococcota bacterium]